MLSKLFKYVAPLPTPDEWAQHNAGKASADSLIVARLLESFAANFDDWKANKDYYFDFPAELTPKPVFKASHYDSRSYTFVLVRERVNGKFAPKIEVRIEYSVKRWRRDESPYDYGNYEIECNKLVVNDTPLNAAFGRKLLFNYMGLKKSITQARSVAYKAKQDMELNEKKWNLVESLFGMRRSGTGVLEAVPDDEYRRTHGMVAA